MRCLLNCIVYDGKLSILMPVYNERTVVERCHPRWSLPRRYPKNMERELVIVDDCSTDGTFAILQRLAAAFPQIQLYQHPSIAGKARRPYRHREGRRRFIR
jgi:glycosyltransferase involved in cell wall biosynthesis